MQFSDYAALVQPYLYGRSHFTRRSCEDRLAAGQQTDITEPGIRQDLQGRVFIVTGAETEIAREVGLYLAESRATVYMVCRSQEGADVGKRSVKDRWQSRGQGNNVHFLLADCSLRADVRRVWDEFLRHSLRSTGEERLDGLICYSDRFSHEKCVTQEHFEATFASNLLFGTYLLGTLAMPFLRSTRGSRLIVVSSWEMYNTAFPDMATAVSAASEEDYDGLSTFAYAARGQVLLCEVWAAASAQVAVVSCHPGWVDTPQLDEIYGSRKDYLEPLRSARQGAEGISWLCAIPASELHSGAFYLDRQPQAKHLAGPFFTEGTATMNSKDEVDDMVRALDGMANGHLDVEMLYRETPTDALPPLKPWSLDSHRFELRQFMGRWYVIASIPMPFEEGMSNTVRVYSMEDQRSGFVLGSIMRARCSHFRSEARHAGSSHTVLEERLAVANAAGTEWHIGPQVGLSPAPIQKYLVLHCPKDYTVAIVGVPNRKHVWIMARQPSLDEQSLAGLKRKAAKLGFDTSKLVQAEQMWDEEGASP